MAPLATLAASALVASPVVTFSTISFAGLRPSARFSSAPSPRLVFSASSLRSHVLRISASAKPDTFPVIQDIIAEQLAIEASSITPDSKFTDLGADSLDTVEIMMALEEKFDIQLEQDNADKIVTVGNAADLIQEVIAAKQR